MEGKDWYLSAGLFNGILFGTRTYEYIGRKEEDSERHYVVDYVLYFVFVQLILTTSKIIDDGE